MSMKEENEKVGFKLNMKETNLGTWPHHFMANRSGNNRSSGRFLLLGGFKSLQMLTAAIKVKDTCTLERKP